jgi:hypothetical protein
VKNTQAKYGISDENIYNFDKTGFQMKIIDTVKVVTGSQRAKSISHTVRESRIVTAVKAINVSD